MAPIDPNQILKAFEPVVSSTGGIKNAKEVPRLSGLMKKYSKKLVSKCVYCNILLATDPAVLEEFLDCEGWQIICEWFQDAIDKDNQSFLIELIKVLRRCPVTLERLKQNDTAKLLKTLTKSTNEELKAMSKELRTKWKTDLFPDDNSSKRKLKDTSNTSNRDGESLSNGSAVVKKLKTKDENVSLNSLNNNDSKKIDKALPSTDKSSIKTVKCKLGKVRSIGLVEKNGAKPVSSANSTPTDHKPGTVLSKGAMLLKNTASTPSPKLNVPTHPAKANGSTGIQIIEPQPLPFTELTAGSASSQQTKHIIKESAGFMDALSSVPSAPKIKKKKKTEKALTDKPPAKSDKSSPELDKADPDSGIDDLNSPLIVSRRLSSSDKNASLESESSETNEFLAFDTPTPYDPDRQPTRGILLLMARGNKREISWSDKKGEKLERVKFFESDENERCNVSKPMGSNNFAEHQKEEREKERDFIKSNKNTLKTINNPGITLIPYRLHLFDFDGVERYSVGTQSEERRIQEERLRNVLEDITLLYTRPDPREPEAEMSIDVLPNAETKEIPLEDENNMISDYSHTPFKVTNETSAAFSPAPIADASNMYGQMNGQMNGQMMGNQMNNYMMNPQFNNVNYNPIMSDASNLYSNQQPMYSSNLYSAMPMVNLNQPMEVDAQWTTSNWNSVSNNQQQQVNQNGNFHNHNNHHHNAGNSHNNKNNHPNSKKGKKPCRYYSKPGGCQKGSTCPFLH